MVAAINHLHAPVTAFEFGCSGTQIYDPEVGIKVQVSLEIKNSNKYSKVVLKFAHGIHTSTIYMREKRLFQV